MSNVLFQFSTTPSFLTPRLKEFFPPTPAERFNIVQHRGHVPEGDGSGQHHDAFFSDIHVSGYQGALLTETNVQGRGVELYGKEGR